MDKNRHTVLTAEATTRAQCATPYRANRPQSQKKRTSWKLLFGKLQEEESVDIAQSTIDVYSTISSISHATFSIEHLID